MQQTEAEFLKELDKRLWVAADRLRSNLDAAVYKHVVLGLIFLKYVSDAFNGKEAEILFLLPTAAGAPMTTKNSSTVSRPASTSSG
jgi:type I restriction enzyme M protein